MRYMVIVKSDGSCTAGAAPDDRFMAEMRKYNEALAKAGILIAVDRLRPASESVRVRFSGAQRTVIDGPYPETKELIGGFWMWRVRSKEEAIEWIKRCPNPPHGEVEVEIREVLEPGDFGPALTHRDQDTGRREHAQAAGRK